MLPSACGLEQNFQDLGRSVYWKTVTGQPITWYVVHWYSSVLLECSHDVTNQWNVGVPIKPIGFELFSYVNTSFVLISFHGRMAASHGWKRSRERCFSLRNWRGWRDQLFSYSTDNSKILFLFFFSSVYYLACEWFVNSFYVSTCTLSKRVTSISLNFEEDHVTQSHNRCHANPWSMSRLATADSTLSHSSAPVTHSTSRKASYNVTLRYICK